jgi:hypothetical protein
VVVDAVGCAATRDLLQPPPSATKDRRRQWSAASLGIWVRRWMAHLQTANELWGATCGVRRVPSDVATQQRLSPENVTRQNRTDASLDTAGHRTCPYLQACMTWRATTTCFVLCVADTRLTKRNSPAGMILSRTTSFQTLSSLMLRGRNTCGDWCRHFLRDRALLLRRVRMESARVWTDTRDDRNKLLSDW